MEHFWRMIDHRHFWFWMAMVWTVIAAGWIALLLLR